MKTKLIQSISIIILLMILISCMPNQNKYDGKYINFTYPNDWEININESINDTQIHFQNELDSDFVIVVEAIKELENEEEIIAQVEKELEAAYQNAQRLKSVEVISYDNTEIDGKIAKELLLEIEMLNSTIEQLYYRLMDNIAYNDEVKAYLNNFKGIEEFTSEVKNKPQLLEELKSLLSKIEVKSIEDEKSKMGAEAYVSNILYLLKEENDSLQRQKTLFTIKKNVSLTIYYYGKVENYEENEEIVQKIIDSIRFQSN